MNDDMQGAIVVVFYRKNTGHGRALERLERSQIFEAGER
jgi:hypothetical protein